MNDKWLRFDAATNPYGPSPKVREAIAAFACTGDFSRYERRGTRRVAVQGFGGALGAFARSLHSVQRVGGSRGLAFLGAIAAKAAAFAHPVSVVRALCGVGAAVRG